MQFNLSLKKIIESGNTFCQQVTEQEINLLITPCSVFFSLKKKNFTSIAD
jgi:hypothetical protein